MWVKKSIQSFEDYQLVDCFLIFNLILSLILQNGIKIGYILRVLQQYKDS